MGERRTLLKPQVLQKFKSLSFMLNVLILLLSVLQLIDSCDALKANDNGTCIKNVAVRSEWRVSVFNSNCPKGYRGCWSQEIKKLKNFKKLQRCCAKKVNVREKRIICCAGWEYINDKDICKPLCECENGKCVLPTKCECEPPLILNLNGTKCITPVCHPPCVNSQCGVNNTCTCNTGFNVFNSTYCSKKCDAGFQNDPITLECTPVCDQPCLNSQCTEPNICTCLEGFKRKDNFTCVPQCTPSCDNGECIATNVCKCNVGYSMANGSCSPVCDETCKNGMCTAPNSCTCDAGYETDQDLFDCHPKCNPECQYNSFCLSPNNCQCLPGYVAIDNATDEIRCKPVCDDCMHGSCVAPNTCKCDPGYFLTANVCTPQCDTVCLNGFCSEPNKCICDQGFELDNGKCNPMTPSLNSTKEEEISFKPCEGPCDNGTCNKGQCVCDPGFQLNDGECNPMKPVDCETCPTNCTKEINCLCNDGRPCFYIPNEPPPPVARKTWLAGFQLTWTVAGAVAVLLFTVLLVVMTRLYRRPRQVDKVDDKYSNRYGSVIYTVPDTLIRDHYIDEGDENIDIDIDACKRETSEQLLSTPEVVVTTHDNFSDAKLKLP